MKTTIVDHNKTQNVRKYLVAMCKIFFRTSRFAIKLRSCMHSLGAYDVLLVSVYVVMSTHKRCCLTRAHLMLGLRSECNIKPRDL